MKRAQELKAGDVLAGGRRVSAVWNDERLMADFYRGDDEHETLRVILVSCEGERVWFVYGDRVEVEENGRKA